MPNFNAGYRRIAECIFFSGIDERRLLTLATYRKSKTFADVRIAVEKAKASWHRRPFRDVETRISDAIREVVIPNAAACKED
ncbi:MAG: hypothetical protein HYT39_03225 [Candidatus Sungbacteria bacterium]|nr:hypothetical protein [Candidatus Sungbacteria bacterium]